MKCRICGKDIETGDICFECQVQNNNTMQNVEISQSKPKQEMKIGSKIMFIIGIILLILTLGLTPLHLVLMFAIGISAANEGTTTFLSKYYGLIFYGVLILGTILLSISKKRKAFLLIPLITVIIIAVISFLVYVLPNLR